MFLKTGNLWTPWIAHTLTNSTLNLLHTVTADGMNGEISLRMTAYSIVALLGMIQVKYIAKRFALLEVLPGKQAKDGTAAKTRFAASPK